MFEKPGFGELAGVGECGDGQGADVVERGVKAGDLSRGEGVAVLFGVDLGIIEDFITFGSRLVLSRPRRGCPAWNNVPDPISNTANVGLV